MKIIVGLGNPGQKFQKTRHNIGFRIIDALAKKYDFPDFEFSKKFNAEINKSAIGGQEIILAKPQTFMNLSGKTARLLTRWRKLECQDLVVVHDDVDLPLGKIRISKGRRAAGHKGVESIIHELQTKDFVRFRVGIKPNLKLKAQSSKPQFKTKNLEKFVLEKFNKEEEKVVKEVIQNAAKAIESSIKSGVEKAMNRYNPLVNTPKGD